MRGLQPNSYFLTLLGSPCPSLSFSNSSLKGLWSGTLHMNVSGRWQSTLKNVIEESLRSPFSSPLKPPRWIAIEQWRPFARPFI